MAARRSKTPTSPYLLPLVIEQQSDGSYMGRSSRLPGFLVQADSIDELLRLAPRVARSLIAAMKSKGVALPIALSAAKTPMRVQLLVAA